VRESDLRRLADALLGADRTHQPTARISTVQPDATVDDAYRIALAVVEARVRAGARVKGHKIGLTSRAMQRAVGIDEPDYGHLLDDMFVDEGAVVPHERLFAPLAEAELAFILREPLPGPGVNAADVVRATDFVLACIEVVDSRFVREGRGTLVDTIADNASSGLVVLGGSPLRLTDLDIRRVGVTVARNGVIEETGVASAVMGNPINAVAWLANKLSHFGVTLEAGQVILSGSFTRMVRFGPGDVVTATFDRFGEVVVSVSAADWALELTDDRGAG
jgi:2-keto-4-pentenoate hydratase